MSIIYDILAEEKQKNLKMQERYEALTSDLPRGSINIKKLGNKNYCYLMFREGKKVKTVYVGAADKHLSQLTKLVNERNNCIKLLKELRQEYKLMCKIVKD